MTTYYISAELSRYIEDNGGRDFLQRIVREHRDGDCRDVPKIQMRPRRYCPNCAIVLQFPGQSPCWHCGKAIT